MAAVASAAGGAVVVVVEVVVVVVLVVVEVVVVGAVVVVEDVGVDVVVVEVEVEVEEVVVGAAVVVGAFGPTRPAEVSCMIPETMSVVYSVAETVGSATSEMSSAYSTAAMPRSLRRTRRSRKPFSFSIPRFVIALMSTAQYLSSSPRQLSAVAGRASWADMPSNPGTPDTSR